MHDLNEPQRQAVHHIDSPLLVLAGAGSGKTRVITRKIAWLIGECGYSPGHIAAVTFTNKAAREMKQRVGELLRGTDSEGLRVSTFHTLGLNIIREDFKKLGYRRGFTIFDSADTQRLLEDILRKQKLNKDEWLDRIRWKIGGWKNALVTPEQALQTASDAFDITAAGAFEAYNRMLLTYNALDFDDLISQPVYLFQDHPEVLGGWQERIRYLLVDEYQDTNACQYQLVRLLIGNRRNLTVVGDDDQSIYAWRGAQPENLQLLSEDFPDLEVIKLEQNYRSSGNILRSANQLIANNPHAFTKQLWSALGPGDDLRVLPCRDGQHEAERIVSGILHHRFQNGLKYQDYAILYRGNHQARPFETALREHNIPYHLSGGLSFFDRTEIKDLMAYLRLLVNNDDDAAFLRAINTPRRGIGAGSIESLNRVAARHHCSLLVAIGQADLEASCGARAASRLQEFANWRQRIADMAERGSPVKAINQLVSDIGYFDWLEQQAPDPQAAARRKDNVQELLDWIENISRRDDEASTLAELLARLTLVDSLDPDEDDDHGNVVRLMTLHAAKGLEFDHVFLAGMEENLLPHKNSIDDSLEEERRLAYVGITRARKSITFTFAQQRKRFHEKIDCEPSRFLQELPEELLSWDDPDKQDDETRRERGRAHLSNLKSLLD